MTPVVAKLCLFICTMTFVWNRTLIYWQELTCIKLGPGRMELCLHCFLFFEPCAHITPTQNHSVACRDLIQSSTCLLNVVWNLPAWNVPSEREALVTQVSASAGFRAWWEDERSGRKTQLVPDLSPILPNLEGGIQGVVYKAKWRWLTWNQDNGTKVRSWFGTEWKER